MWHFVWNKYKDCALAAVVWKSFLYFIVNKIIFKRVGCTKWLENRMRHYHVCVYQMYTQWVQKRQPAKKMKGNFFTRLAQNEILFFVHRTIKINHKSYRIYSQRIWFKVLKLNSLSHSIGRKEFLLLHLESRVIYANCSFCFLFSRFSQREILFFFLSVASFFMVHMNLNNIVI